MNKAPIKAKSAEAMLQQLKNPFDIKFVKYRIGAQNKNKTKAIPLFYTNSREIQKRLDDVCGIAGWSSKMISTDKGIICELSIKMPDGSWITRSDGGEYSKISSFKGGCSDALKRAAAQFGIGRYLYYIPNTWQEIENGQFKSRPEMPKWAYPQNGIQDWEDLAVQEYNQENDYSEEEDNNFINSEKEEIIQSSESVKQVIIENLTKK